MVKPKPGPVRELFNRAPVLLYRAHLGWALGSNLLMLTTTGRKTGRTRRTVVEVAKSSPNRGSAPTLWVIAGRGRQSDWYANAISGGLTRITWMNHFFTPRVHALSADERFDLLVDYQHRHPRAATMLGKAALGGSFTGAHDELRRLADDLRALRLEPAEIDDLRAVDLNEDEGHR